MRVPDSSYSPDILLYLLIGEKRVRLADVLMETARLYESTECPPGTGAELIFSIDGAEKRQAIMLDEGLSKDKKFFSFSYLPHASSGISDVAF